MSMEHIIPDDPPLSTNPLDWYGSYPFESDETYQQGLASIIAGGALNGDPTPDVKEEILRRTRVFYFNKMTDNSISMDEAREYERAHRKDTSSDAQTSIDASRATSEETRVLTFAELKELIETGKVDQIPNNKIIPEALNDAPPSQSTAPTRRKPWEVTASSTEV
ncbi:hypothetical protein BDQ12DRAFT_701316 [Crucibulum laeve]|uniref:Uncharacterized protein n=1 Tax=Crucibulum laeve TaxID=68775 RepID=A0A5C3LHE0_9AGAR|nr:hypothetical protein BDQ12DRAFT_701316 [Crucibulum laeve]